jgi:hypothetical protein
MCRLTTCQCGSPKTACETGTVAMRYGRRRGSPFARRHGRGREGARDARLSRAVGLSCLNPRQGTLLPPPEPIGGRRRDPKRASCWNAGGAYHAATACPTPWGGRTGRLTSSPEPPAPRVLARQQRFRERARRALPHAGSTASGVCDFPLPMRNHSSEGDHATGTQIASRGYKLPLTSN